MAILVATLSVRVALQSSVSTRDARCMPIVRGDVDAIVKNVLCGHLASIEKASERDALVVYGPIVWGLDRLLNDAIEAIEHRNQRLILILNTPGGIAEVVERMVDSI